MSEIRTSANSGDGISSGLMETLRADCEWLRLQEASRLLDRCPFPKKQGNVDRQVSEDQSKPQCELKGSGEAGGIQDRQDIVLDEPAGVPRLAGTSPECVLQWSERTDPATELNPDSPYRGRDVEERKPGVSQDQKSAEHHEKHETEMDEDNEVGHRRG
jgi:hypothetical protein